MNVTRWCNRVIQLGFCLLFILVPLILTPWNYELFEYNKMMITYGLTVVIVAAWLVKSLIQGELRLAKTPLDIPLGLFFLSQLVSALFSLDPHVSWFGYYSRFNGGLWSVTSYILLYFAFVSNFSELGLINEAGKNQTPKSLTDHPEHLSHNSLLLLRVALATAAIVALYAVAERLGIDKHLWVQDVQTRVFSTLGQPNWLAAYLVALIPLSAGFALKARKVWSRESVIWGLITILFFTVLLFTRSRSGLLGFVLVDIIFWAGILLKNTERKALQTKALLLHSAFFLIVFFNGAYVDTIDRYFTLKGWVNLVNKSKVTTTTARQNPSGPLLEYGGTESGTIRKYVWQGALNAWRSSTKTLLIGTGTETFAFAFYQYRPSAHNLTSEWDFLYNKAHNEYLNYLATTGIFGLGSYLLFIGTFIWWFIKNQIRGSNFMPLALFAGWVSILVTNFFGFSVVIIQVFLFLFPALILVLYRTQLTTIPPPRMLKLRPPPPWPSVILGSAILLALFLEYTLVKYWVADLAFASGYRYSRAGQYVSAQTSLEKAISLNANEPFYHDELGSVLASLAVAALEGRDATAAAALAKRSLSESDTALSVSPKNVNWWKSRTKIYYAFSSFDPKFNPAAITALLQAQALSPNDPKIVYNLAILYGRQNENEKAIELLKTAIDLKPNYRDAYNALYLFYKEVNQPALAGATLNQYLTLVDPNDKDFREKLAQ